MSLNTWNVKNFRISFIAYWKIKIKMNYYFDMKHGRIVFFHISYISNRRLKH